MKKLILAAVAVLGLGSHAFAAIVDGVVRAYDPHTRVLWLKGGRDYTLPPGTPVPPEMRPGHKVTLVIDDDDPTEVRTVLLFPSSR
ncbi:MAG: hypothetical protein ABTQ31_17585 [Rhizobiaceae bacterium]